jgi:hypothetical protein
VIVFDLRCGAGHVFEAWFASSGAYEDQRARALVACPMCGDTGVGKAVMAPAVPAKANKAPSAQVIKAALASLAQAQAKALESSTWVGRDFASRARAMHDGAEPHSSIHGQATPAEAKGLAEDGVAVAPLPLPVVPPEAQN